MRRCTICGWKIGEGELFWYIASAQNVALLSQRPEILDQAIEGAGHEECLVYSAMACPFLSSPSYRRRDDQLAANGEFLSSKGERREEMVLAGARAMRPQLDMTGDFKVLMQGIVSVTPISDQLRLKKRSNHLAATVSRSEDVEDRDFVDLLTAEDGPEIEAMTDAASQWAIANQSFTWTTSGVAEPHPTKLLGNRRSRRSSRRQ